VELGRVATEEVAAASFISVQRLLPMPDQSLLTVVLVGMVLQLDLQVVVVEQEVEED
jgi:hypothetical protein